MVGVSPPENPCILEIGRGFKTQALVAHARNPSYSGDRDREDHGSKPAWANSSQNLISKNLSEKGLVE
jgi:hypothetical protein